MTIFWTQFIMPLSCNITLTWIQGQIRMPHFFSMLMQPFMMRLMVQLLAMHNLQGCVDSSTTAASFCLRYIQSSAPTKQCIRNLTTAHLHHLMCKLYPILTNATYPDLDNNEVEFTQCIQLTFIRATNLVIDNLTSELRSHFTKGIPSSYLSLLK